MKVKAKLVSIDWPVTLRSPADEIHLMEPNQILLLQLKGITVTDLSDMLNLDAEMVNKEECYVP